MHLISNFGKPSSGKLFRYSPVAGFYWFVLTQPGPVIILIRDFLVIPAIIRLSTFPHFLRPGEFSRGNIRYGYLLTSAMQGSTPWIFRKYAGQNCAGSHAI